MTLDDLHRIEQYATAAREWTGPTACVVYSRRASLQDVPDLIAEIFRLRQRLEARGASADEIDGMEEEEEDYDDPEDI